MLADILKTLGPCLSTELTEYLVTQRGMSPAAARQRVSRGAPQIKRLIECKGIAPGTLVDDEEVGLWLTTRITRVRHHLQQLGWSGPLPRFELWTSGALSALAHERVEKTRQANSKKFEITVVEGDALRASVKAVNDASLLKTFEHHFLPQAAS